MPFLHRWFATIAVAVVVAAACAAAGVWQWNRHVDRSAAIALVEQNYGAPAAPLEELVTDPAVPLDADDVWRTAAVSGRYLDAPVLLRNRPVGGQPGFHVLVPFLIEDGDLSGRVLVVDRGWVPTGEDGSGAVDIPSPPVGRVDLLARLRAAERPSARSAPAGQVQAIAPEQVRTAAGVPGWEPGASLSTYGMVVKESGTAPAALGPLPVPSTHPGSHLSYAFQWWVFAVGALVGCVVLIMRESRREASEEAGRGPDGRAAPPSAAPARARRRPTAEEEEDAILDAQQSR